MFKESNNSEIYIYDNRYKTGVTIIQAINHTEMGWQRERKKASKLYVTHLRSFSVLSSPIIKTSIHVI